MPKLHIKCTEREHESSQLLLTINAINLATVATLESDDGIEKMFAVAIKLGSIIIRYSKRKDIILKRLALAFSPDVGRW